MTDDELFQRMRQSYLRIDFPSDFQREIWGRIEAADLDSPTRRLSHYWARGLGWLARPVPAIALAVLMGAGGCFLAILAGHRRAPRLAETAYVNSVSPFAVARLEPRR